MDVPNICNFFEQIKMTYCFFLETTDGNKVYNVVTAEKFLRGTIVRAFANGFFLLVGWGLVAIFAKKKIAFLNNAAGKKRRRRRGISTFKQNEKLNDLNEFSIEANFANVLSKLS